MVSCSRCPTCSTTARDCAWPSGLPLARVALTGILMLATTSALAEPKRVKTEAIQASAPGPHILYVVEEDGTVRIDWKTVEAIVDAKSDRILLPVAQLMLAIRDHTWKPPHR